MKEMVRFYKKTKLKSPIFIAAWPGMGNVALKTIKYLIDNLKAVRCAVMEGNSLFYPDQAWIHNGTIGLPRFPKGEFFYWKDPKQAHDILFFVSEAQPISEKCYTYAHKVLEVAESFNCRKVLTFAAMPLSIEHTQSPHVWCAATNKALFLSIKRFQVKRMDSGQISGMNGLLLSVAKERNKEGLCLLGEIPLYTIQIDNPKASLAILEVLSRFLDLGLDLRELKDQAAANEEEIDNLIDYFRGGSMDPKDPISDEEVEKMKDSLRALGSLPNSIKDKIEKLFRIAQKDLSMAKELKKELDNWSIYKDYEDRFLDLFKRDNEKNKQ